MSGVSGPAPGAGRVSASRADAVPADPAGAGSSATPDAPASPAMPAAAPSTRAGSVGFQTLMLSTLSEVYAPDGDAPLGLDSIHGGRAHLELPVAAGTHLLEVGGDEKLSVEVDQGTKLVLDGQIRPGPNGPRLEGVRLSFSHPLTLENPGAFIDSAFEELGDALTDVSLSGFHATADGRLDLDGDLVLPFGVRRSLSRAASAAALPRLDLDLKDILAGRFVAARGTHAGTARLDPGTLLRELGPVLGRGSFDIRLEGEHSSIELGADRVVLEGTEPRDARATIRGLVDLNDAGGFELRGTADAATAVGTGHASFTGLAGLGQAERPFARIDVDATANLSDLRGVDRRTHRPFTIDGDATHEELAGHCTFRAGVGGGPRVESGTVRVDVTGRTPIDAERDGRGAFFDAHGRVTGSAEVSGAPGAWEVRDGRFHAETTGDAGVAIRGSALEGEVTGPTTAGVDATVSAAPGESLHAEADVDVRLADATGTGSVTSESAHVPLRVGGADSVIAGRMHVTLDGSRVRVASDRMDARLHLTSGERPRVDILGGHLRLDGTGLVTGHTALRFDRAGGLELTGAEVRVTAALREGRFDRDGLRLRLGEGSSVTVDLHELQVSPRGVRLGSSDSAFDLHLDGRDVEIGALRLTLDEAEASRIRGTTTLLELTPRGHLRVADEGEATLSLELHGRGGDGAVGGAPLTLGDGAQRFTGTARVRVTPRAVEIVSGELHADVDLGSTRIDRTATPPAPPR